jgi:hypothetical protein
MDTMDELGRLQVVDIDLDPDHCPICHHGIKPKDVKRDCLAGKNTVERVFQCPRRDCGHLFIARYRQTPGYSLYRLIGCVPLELRDVDLPREVNKLSPDFCKIFNQAQRQKKVVGS